jgi:hypothetical protein
MNGVRDMPVVTSTTSRLWLVAALSLGGCSLGQGSGYVSGPLVVVDCTGAGKTLVNTTGLPYEMHPDFFAAEPFRDTRTGSMRTNRLIIRVQKTGRQRELNDVLRFDIPDVYLVGRCVRGDVQPGFDDKNCVPTKTGARVRVSPDSLIRAYFTPRFTCAYLGVANVVATAYSKAGDSTEWQSWIELEDFGHAKDGPVTVGFFVDFGQRLRAPAFHLELEDDKVLRAPPGVEPPPQRDINGTLDGAFDFDLERGQGAQTFP